MINKRINLLSYYDVFSGLDVKSRDAIINSFLEHTISDLGFSIKLNSEDIRNTLSKDFPEIESLISNIVDNTLLCYCADKEVQIEMIAPLIYTIKIN